MKRTILAAAILVLVAGPAKAQQQLYAAPAGTRFFALVIDLFKKRVDKMWWYECEQAKARSRLTGETCPEKPDIETAAEQLTWAMNKLTLQQRQCLYFIHSLDRCRIDGEATRAALFFNAALAFLDQ